MLVLIKVTTCWLLSCFLVWKTFWYIGYRLSVPNDHDAIHLKWKMVKQLYRINPDRFNYSNDYDYDSTFKMLSYNTCHSGYSDTIIILSFFGYQLLRINYLLYLLERKRKARNKALETVLKTAQQDIERELAKANEEIEEGLKETERVIREWK